MTLKQIVDETKFWLGKERCSIGASGDEATEKLAECARRTLEKIALEYAPLVEVASVTARGGRFSLADLPRHAIAVKKVKSGDRTIAFRCLGEVCEVAENGALELQGEDVARVARARRAEQEACRCQLDAWCHISQIWLQNKPPVRPKHGIGRKKAATARKNGRTPRRTTAVAEGFRGNYTRREGRNCKQTLKRC